MILNKNGNENAENAVIILHEIYGINHFIKDVCRLYKEEGFDVFCPELLEAGIVFSYEKEQEAYRAFMENPGLDRYKDVLHLVSELKLKYRRVFIAGFSVGATLAWRCALDKEAETAGCGKVPDGVICCYGSRIRDYLDVPPRCPVLLIFAKYDSFDVETTASLLDHFAGTRVKVAEAYHGFADKFSGHYCAEAEQLYLTERKRFLSELQVSFHEKSSSAKTSADEAVVDEGSGWPKKQLLKAAAEAAVASYTG